MITDSPNQQGWLYHPLGRNQPVACKLDHRAAESREVVSRENWDKGKVGIAVPLANSALTDVELSSCIAVPRARLTVLQTSHRKKLGFPELHGVLKHSPYIKTDCWASFAGSAGILHSINHMWFYMWKPECELKLLRFNIAQVFSSAPFQWLESRDVHF